MLHEWRIPLLWVNGWMNWPTNRTDTKVWQLLLTARNVRATIYTQLLPTHPPLLLRWNVEMTSGLHARMMRTSVWVKGWTNGTVEWNNQRSEKSVFQLRTAYGPHGTSGRYTLKLHRLIEMVQNVCHYWNKTSVTTLNCVEKLPAEGVLGRTRISRLAWSRAQTCEFQDQCSSRRWCLQWGTWWSWSPWPTTWWTPLGGPPAARRRSQAVWIYSYSLPVKNCSFPVKTAAYAAGTPSCLVPPR